MIIIIIIITIMIIIIIIIIDNNVTYLYSALFFETQSVLQQLFGDFMAQMATITILIEKIRRI